MSATGTPAPKERDPLILAVKVREMMGLGYELLAYMPKMQKHALAADIRDTMTTLLRTFDLARARALDLTPARVIEHVRWRRATGAGRAGAVFLAP